MSGSTDNNRQTFGVRSVLWEGSMPWHTGILQGAERVLTSWHGNEEETSRIHAINKDL